MTRLLFIKIVAFPIFTLIAVDAHRLHLTFSGYSLLSSNGPSAACNDSKRIDKTYLHVPAGYLGPPPWSADRTTAYQSPSLDELMASLLDSMITGLFNTTVGDLFTTYASNNCYLYPVGGSVRDQFRLAVPSDVDAETNCDHTTMWKICNDTYGAAMCSSYGGLILHVGSEPMAFEEMQMGDIFFGNKTSLEYTVNAIAYDYTNKVFYDLTGYSLQDNCDLRISIPVTQTMWDNWCDEKKIFRYWKLRNKGYNSDDPATQKYIVTKALNYLADTTVDGKEVCRYVTRGDVQYDANLKGWTRLCYQSTCDLVDTYMKTFHDDVMTQASQLSWVTTVCRKLKLITWMCNDKRTYFNGTRFCTETPCESNDWYFFNGNCYWSSFSLPSSQQSNFWSSADLVCRSMNANLTSVHSAEELGHVQGLTGCSNTWIGLQYTNSASSFATASSWTWSDDSPNDFNSWLEGITTAGTGNGNSCAYVASSNNYWENGYCYDYQFPFVCKKPALVGVNQLGDLYCPPGWTYRYKSCYLYQPQLMSFFAAQMQCQTAVPGAHLAFIESANENVFLSWFRSSCQNVWIGIQNINPAAYSTPAGWRWLDTSSVAYTNWVSGYPKGNPCAAISTNNAEWMDYPCSSTSYEYASICEIEVGR